MRSTKYNFAKEHTGKTNIFFISAKTVKYVLFSKSSFIIFCYNGFSGTLYYMNSTIIFVLFLLLTHRFFYGIISCVSIDVMFHTNNSFQ